MLKMDPKEAANVLLSRSKVTKDSKVVLLGSNYRIFQTMKAEPECPKCADSFELADPTPTDLFTFEVSLVAKRLLSENGIRAKVLVMPSDFVRGIEASELDAFRKGYALPASFREMLDLHFIPLEDRIFILESRFRSRSLNILRKRILRDRAIPSREIEEDGKTTIFSGQLGSFMGIPLGSVVGPEGRSFAIPYCQVICSAIYERIGSMGFTDILGMFNDSERVCVNQGTTIAKELGYLRMNALISIFKQEESGFGLIDLKSY
jgi:hypothetical protein